MKINGTHQDVSRDRISALVKPNQSIVYEYRPKSRKGMKQQRGLRAYGTNLVISDGGKDNFQKGKFQVQARDLARYPRIRKRTAEDQDSHNASLQSELYHVELLPAVMHWHGAIGVGLE